MMWFDAGWVNSCRESKACDPTRKSAFISQDAAPSLLCSSCLKRDADIDYVMTHPHTKTLQIHAHQASLLVLNESDILSGNVTQGPGFSADPTEGMPLAPHDFIVWMKPWIHSHAAPERCGKHWPGHWDSLPFQMAFGQILHTLTPALLTDLPGR